MYLDVPGCTLLYLAVPGCTLLYLAVTGRIWLCLAIPGCNWLYMAVPGYTWLYLSVPGCTWLYLSVTGCIWLYLAVQCTWLYLALTGRSWSYIALDGFTWLYLAVPGCTDICVLNTPFPPRTLRFPSDIDFAPLSTICPQQGALPESGNGPGPVLNTIVCPTLMQFQGKYWKLSKRNTENNIGYTVNTPTETGRWWTISNATPKEIWFIWNNGNTQNNTWNKIQRDGHGPVLNSIVCQSLMQLWERKYHRAAQIF